MSNNTSPEFDKFSLPSNAFYGRGNANSTNTSASHSLEKLKTSSSDLKTSRISRTTFTQSTSRTTVKETFLKKLGPDSRQMRKSTDSRKSLLSLPVNTINEKVARDRSVSPDWETCRFSLPARKNKDDLQKEDDQKENLPQKDDQKENHPKKDDQIEIQPKKDDQKGNQQKEKIDKKKKPSQNKEVKRRSLPKKDEGESKNEKRIRSVSPDWNTSRFSLGPVTPKNIQTSPRSSRSPPKKKTSPPMNVNSSPSNNRSASPDWETSRFALPEFPVESKSNNKKIPKVSPRILTSKLKTKINKNTMYKISQLTLDKLLPKPEIHLFDVVKYGAQPQHKDDFLFGLNLMRSEVLNKIDLLHYKKKLRNTGTNFIRTFQQPKIRSPNKKSESDSTSTKTVEKLEESMVSIGIPDESNQPEEIIIKDVEKVNVDSTKEYITTDEIVEPAEVIQIEDDGDKIVDTESEKLLEEAIQDFADQFGGEVVDETTETSNVIDSNINNSTLLNVNGNDKNTAEESVKISETNTFYHSVTKKPNKNSLDLNTKTPNSHLKRNSLPNIKVKNGSLKKKPSPNKKKKIIKVKWPVARKSLLDLRNNS